MNTMVLRSAAVALLLAAAAVPDRAQANFFDRSHFPALLEGAWKVTTVPVNCTTGQTFPQFTAQSRVTFAFGGTLTEINSNADFQPGQRSAGLGYWERTDRRSYRAYFEAFLQFDSVDPPPTARSYHRGTQSFDHSIEMQDADHWTSDAAVTFRDISGATIFLNGCAKSTAERM